MDDSNLLRLMRLIDEGQRADASDMLRTTPELAIARLERGATRTTSIQYFLPTCRLQLYAGDTALHVAAAAYDVALARELIDGGADVAAQNRRRAQPIHAAVTGGPGSNHWNPSAQAAMLTYLIERGADPEALAAGGVTPLHRAVRNRCSAAVRALIDAGADPHRTNDAGSTAEQALIVQLFTGR